MSMLAAIEIVRKSDDNSEHLSVPQGTYQPVTSLRSQRVAGNNDLSTVKVNSSSTMPAGLSSSSTMYLSGTQPVP